MDRVKRNNFHSPRVVLNEPNAIISQLPMYELQVVTSVGSVKKLGLHCKRIGNLYPLARDLLALSSGQHRWQSTQLLR